MPQKPEYALAGVRMKQHLSSHETNGGFSLFENKSEAPSRTPIHIHAHDDETLFILEGEMRATIDGKDHIVRAGNSVFLPRHVPHQLLNDSGASAHYLLLCTPAGFEGFLREAGHELRSDDELQPFSAADRERMIAAAPKFGITLLADWPNAPLSLGPDRGVI